MTRAARLDLRSFQQELATRLAAKTTAQVESSRLGIECRGERWLVRLSDAGEVIAVPPIVRVPLTQRWFLGLANIRGNLFSVIDFPAFLGREGVVLGSLARLHAAHADASAPAWHVQLWTDADGDTWQEIDLAKLARDPAFLQVGA